LQIALGFFQAAKRFGAAGLVVSDARSFLEERAPLIGAQRQGLFDQALADDRVGALGQTAGRQQIGHIFQPHLLAVDEVFVLAGTKRAPGDFDLSVVNGQPTVAVVEGDRRLGHAGASALRATGENHVGRAAGAQRAVALLAQHPAQGVGDVALAAAVGADDGRDAAVEQEFRLRGERFIALEAEFAQLHTLSITLGNFSALDE